MPTCGQCGTIEEDRAARYCRSCGTALSVSQLPPELQRIDMRGTVTVVRCDIVDSTPLVERHDPELVRRILTTYSDTARQTVARFGGMLERFVGDAVMAIFGFPMPREDDAVRAVRAAVELRERLGGFSERLQRDGIALGVRFAVDTGEIVAGRDDSGQLVFTGDVMNVVTRLEQAAPPGEILLGDATVGLLRELVEVEHVGPLYLKGKSGPVAAHRLLLLPDASRQARDLEIPLVGRDLDCTILEKLHVRTVQTRTSHLLTVFGAAGIGKSRLVEEFLRKVDGQPLVLRGRCLAYGGAAYDPIIQVIAQAADVDLADREQVRQRLAALVAGDEHASRIVERLEHMLELRSGTGPAEDTRWAVRRLLEILAAKHPLIVVLDDLHWAEPTLLGLVEDLAESLHTTPLLLVCLARTDLLDQRRRWAGGKVGATSMQLAPLGPDDVRRLVTSLLGDVPAAPEVQAYITELAGGNPLFVQSLVATLREARRLRLSEDREQWQAATDLAALPAPPDMQAVLQARIANLRPEEKRVIERAAVIGRQFSVDAVIDLSEGDERRGCRPRRARTCPRSTSSSAITWSVPTTTWSGSAATSSAARGWRGGRARRWRSPGSARPPAVTSRRSRSRCWSGRCGCWPATTRCAAAPCSAWPTRWPPRATRRGRSRSMTRWWPPPSRPRTCPPPPAPGSGGWRSSGSTAWPARRPRTRTRWSTRSRCSTSPTTTSGWPRRGGCGPTCTGRSATCSQRGMPPTPRSSWRGRPATSAWRPPG
jgi:class 3 adenylate cyclase